MDPVEFSVSNTVQTRFKPFFLSFSKAEKGMSERVSERLFLQEAELQVSK